jgi:hypothetical protein
MDCEERRRNGFSVDTCLAAAPDPWAVEFGAPTDSIVHFFRIYYPHHTGFQRQLFAALLVPLDEWTEADGGGPVYPAVPVQGEWNPPCGSSGGCGARLCGATCRRFSILLHAVALVRDMARQVAALEDYSTSVISVVVDNLYAHVDSHMPLLHMLHLLYPGYAGASAYGEPRAASPHCPNVMWAEAYAHARPDLQYAFTRHNLPDMSILVPLSISYNHDDVSNKRTIQKKFPDVDDDTLSALLSIDNLMYKLVPHRCNIREPHKSIKNACSKNQIMVQLVCKMLLATWLGVYRTAPTKMPIFIRVIAYRFFLREIPMNEIMNTFETSNTTMLTYLAKEFYCEMTGRMPGFRRAMESAYEWDKYILYTQRVNEMVRAKMIQNIRLRHDGGLTSLADVFRGIDDHIVHMHEEYRQYQRSNNVRYDLTEIIRLCIDINYNNYALDPENNPAHCVVPGEEYRLPDPNPALEAGRLEVMRKIVTVFPPHQKVPMDILVCFGVPVRDIVDMKLAVFSKKPDLERALRALTPAVYAVFFNFFRACNERNVYTEYRGDAFMYYCHCLALQKGYKLRDGEAIPVVAGRLQACDSCRDVKHPSFFPREVKNKHSDGKGNVAITGDGETVCACRPQAAPWRELYLMENGEHAPSLVFKKAVRNTPETLNRKFAKHVGTQITHYMCQRTRTRTINALGRVSLYVGTPYVACFEDLKVTSLEKMKYVGDRILCGDCRDYCQRELRIKAITGERRGCEYCNKVLLGVGEKEFFLFDDEAEDERRGFRVMRFCGAHGPMHWVRAGQYTRKSDVIRGVSERWESMGQNNQYIPCGPPS